MIKMIRKDELYYEDHQWLRLYSVLSFSNYLDPDNVCFGILATLNEYFVEQGHGFPMHPHQNMELLYFILDGRYSHRDSMGNDCVVLSGDIQRVSAGSGMARATHNIGSEELRYLGVWLLPKVKDIAPSATVKHFSPELYRNKFFLVASDKGLGVADAESPIMFNSAASVYRAVLDRTEQPYIFTPMRACQLLFMLSGKILLNGAPMSARDHARITGEKLLNITVEEGADLLILDMASC